MQINQNLEIVMMPVNEIIPYWRNPRKNDKTVDALEQRLPKAGFNVPIVVDKNHVVIKGHARLRAAKRLGMEKVPVIVSDVPEDVAKADRIADNKIQEMSSWEFGKLNLEVDRLPRMQMRNLFRQEESPVGDFDAEDMPSVEFKPVGLDFSTADGDYEPSGINSPSETGQEFEQDYTASEVTPVGHAEMPMRVDVPQPSGVPEKRQLKTLCPYCGKVVLISV